MSPFLRKALVVLAGTLLSLPALADSQARIVRLSDVQGSVQIDKNTGLGFENAFLNLPVTQGAQVRTSSGGRAEIEFEDGSTMRVAPNTLLQFDTLSLNDAGKRVSVMTLVKGMAYVNWQGKNEPFTLNFSREKVELDRAAHFRVEALPTIAKLAVFSGDIEVAGPSGSVTINKKKMGTFDVTDEDKFTLAKDFENAPLDAWDKESIDYHRQYAKNNTSPYGYGFSDLNYYGGYQNVPGYGMMWQPYFTGIGWDPFMDGAWSFYPGFGYMFVSAYPWGWLPYRYGNWMFVPGFGWMWQPGYWNSWSVLPRYTNTTAVKFHAPAAPSGTGATVAVGKGGPRLSTGTASRLVLTKGSAGLGISRGSVSNLSHLNTQVAKSGTVEVRSTPQFAASTPRSSGGFSGGGRSTAMSSGSGSHGSSSHSSGGGGSAHR